MLILTDVLPAGVIIEAGFRSNLIEDNMSIYKCNTNIKTAFTLAEVLITLLIIGVVASLIIPNLINDAQNAEFKAAYKKAYGVASQAILKAYVDGQLQPRTGWCSASESLDNWNAFKNQFVVVKECSSTNYQNSCWADGELIYQAATPPGIPLSGGGTVFFVDNSGMNWMYHPCYWYLLDTNGLKGPNKYGKDRFTFTFTSDQSNNNGSTGNPIMVGVKSDYSNIDLNNCPSGGCYYRSWLSQ
jgi:prepilin-type N-terminal cleavage/methylation domain-containing protein